MRFLDFMGGLRYPISNEETKILDKISEKSFSPINDLNEREIEIAKKMVTRGLLSRVKHHGQSGYIVNKLQYFGE